MLLETMWYVLFNVIVSVQSIYSNLFEVVRVYKLNRIQRWKTGRLGIFPHLITGIIATFGRSGNFSMISEYINFKGRIVSIIDLGSTISQATASGNFP